VRVGTLRSRIAALVITALFWTVGAGCRQNFEAFARSSYVAARARELPMRYPSLAAREPSLLVEGRQADIRLGSSTQLLTALHLAPGR